MTLDNDFDLLDYMNIGNILTRLGVVTAKQVRSALERQSRHGGRLGENLVALGVCDADDVRRALQEQELRVLPESKSDGALERLGVAVDKLEESSERLRKIKTTKTAGKVVIDLADDQSGAMPISPPKLMVV
jgi:hypothetical protein